MFLVFVFVFMVAIAVSVGTVFLWKGFIYNGLRASVAIKVIEGKVLDSRVFTETSVRTSTTSSGGGGYVSPQSGGYVSAPTTDTKTTVTSIRKEQVFVRLESGRELDFVSDDGGVSFRLWTR